MDYSQFNDLGNPYAHVSHETFMRLQAYVELLELWQPKINLVSQTTLENIWSRHILDSTQLAKYLPTNGQAMDFGSGGGFPGAVLAIMTNTPFTLVESDQRKCAFLLEVSRITQTPFKVLTQRVEALSPVLDIVAITARAFASLSKILTLSKPWLSTGAKGIFLKGKDAAVEITEAQKAWSFDCQAYPSVSDPAASILVVSDLKPR